jgi:poly(hydroxyalkanoate) depolymerase family esterase
MRIGNRIVSVTLAAALLCALSAVAGGSASAAPKSKGTLSHGVYPPNATPGSDGSREYWLYVPDVNGNKPMPLVVYLHGCLQTSADAIAQTRFDDLADQRGFAVVYPQQIWRTDNQSAPFADGNGLGCWNWFLPDDQHRDAGEPALIAGVTRQVLATARIDPSRVYIGGISAGGAMSTIMAATYPDLYAAAASLAGGPYGTYADPTGTRTYQEMGQRARVVPLLVEQGTADTLNPYPVGIDLVSSWLGADDYADNGANDGSISRLPADVRNEEFDQTPNPVPDDPAGVPDRVCVYLDPPHNNWPCPGGVVGFEDSYPYTVASYEDGAGCDILDFWTIHGVRT